MRIFVFMAVIALLETSTIYADIIFAAKQGEAEDIIAIDEAGNTRNLSENPARDLEPAVSIDKTVAFMSARDGSFDIFTCNSSGSNLKNITRSPGYEATPLFSPDGKWIAFRSGKENESELKIVKIDGSQAEIIAFADDILDFSWSPDNNKLTYAAMKGTQSSLIVVERSTRKSKTLVQTSVESHLQSEMFSKPMPIRVQITASKWSPDGRYIAYTKHPEVGDNQQLRIIEPETMEDRLLTEKNYQPQNPVWSKDSQRILYACASVLNIVIQQETGKKSFEGSVDVFITSLDGKTQKITKGRGICRRPVFSPDEQKIAFLYEDGVLSDKTCIRTMKIDGTDMRTIYDGVFDRTSLQWF